MKQTNLLILGFTIITAFALFIGGILFLKQVSLSKSYFDVSVHFSDVQGLNIGDSVSMLGKRIGRVDKIRLTGGRIVVDLLLESAFEDKIPDDSGFEVKSSGMLGEMFVSIQPGEAKHYIKQNATIKGTRELNLAEIAPGIIPITEDIGSIVKQLKNVLGEDESENIRQTLQHISSASRSLDSLLLGSQSLLNVENRAKFAQSLENFSRLSKQLSTEIAANSDSIASITGNFKTMSEHSVQIVDSLGANLNNGSRDLIIKLDAVAVNLFRTAEKLGHSVTKLDSALVHGAGIIPNLLHNAETNQKFESLLDSLSAGMKIAVANFVESSENVNAFTKDVKDNPVKYLKLYLEEKKKTEEKWKLWKN